MCTARVDVVEAREGEFLDAVVGLVKQGSLQSPMQLGEHKEGDLVLQHQQVQPCLFGVQGYVGRQVDEVFAVLFVSGQLRCPLALAHVPTEKEHGEEHEAAVEQQHLGHLLGAQDERVPLIAAASLSVHAPRPPKEISSIKTEPVGEEHDDAALVGAGYERRATALVALVRTHGGDKDNVTACPHVVVVRACLELELEPPAGGGASSLYWSAVGSATAAAEFRRWRSRRV